MQYFAHREKDDLQSFELKHDRKFQNREHEKNPKAMSSQLYQQYGKRNLRRKNEGFTTRKKQSLLCGN